MDLVPMNRKNDHVDLNRPLAYLWIKEFFEICLFVLSKQFKPVVNEPIVWGHPQLSIFLQADFIENVLYKRCHSC